MTVRSRWSLEEALALWGSFFPETSEEQKAVLSAIVETLCPWPPKDVSPGVLPRLCGLGSRLACTTEVSPGIVWSIFESWLQRVQPSEISIVRAFAAIHEGFSLQRSAEKEAALLEEAMLGFRDFAGVLTHDINNFLTIIQVHLDLLTFESGGDEAWSKDVEEIQGAVDKAIEYIRLLLPLGQRRRLEFEAVSAEVLLASWLAELSTSLPPSVEVESRLQTPLPWLAIERGAFGSVVAALASNALEAMPEGGHLQITASTLPESLAFPTAPHLRGGLKLTLQDSGRSFSASERRRIFFPYTTTKRGKKSAGLGLSIAYLTTRAHQGILCLTPAPQGGTTAVLLLPPAPVGRT